MFYNVMKNGCKELPKGGPNGCDVRDVAWAHVRAIQVEEAVNHRFIISIGPTAYQQWTEWLKANVPDWPFDAGKPGDVQKSIDPKNAVVFDGSLTENVLGFKYRHWDETTKDMYYSLVEREKAGWP